MHQVTEESIFTRTPGNPHPVVVMAEFDTQAEADEYRRLYDTAFPPEPTYEALTNDTCREYTEATG